MSSLKNIFLLALKNNKTGDVTYKEFKKMMKGADEQTKRLYFYKNNADTNPRLIERQTSLNIPILTSLNNLNISMNPILTLTEGKTFGGSFNEAFKLARLGGLKTFTWNGKLYKTELASENLKGKTESKNKTKSVSNGKNPIIEIGPVKYNGPEYFGTTYSYGLTNSGLPRLTISKLLTPERISTVYYTDKGLRLPNGNYALTTAPNSSMEDEIKFPVGGTYVPPEQISDIYVRRPNIDMWGNIIPDDKFVPGWDRITPVVGKKAKKRNGGIMNLNKFQQGGKTSSQQDAVMQFVEALAQTLQADPQLVIQAALLNPEALKSAVQVYLETLGDIQKAAQAFQLALQSQTQAAKHGAKLNYLKTLKNQCAEDEELVYFKKGGKVGCGCKKKGGEIKEEKKESPIDKFKKMSTGGQTPKKKKLDQASKDSIEINDKQNMELMSERPGKLIPNPKYDKGKTDDRALIWVPDRTKEPYKKEEKVKKNCGGSKMKLQKGDKVKSAGAGCIAKFKMHKLGGSLNGIPFMLQGKDLPIAEPAKIRYKGANGIKYGDRNVTILEIWNPDTNAKIKLEVLGKDSTITEIPPHSLYVAPKRRIASNMRHSIPPYEFINKEWPILKRRFEEAKLVMSRVPYYSPKDGTYPLPE